MYVLWNWYGTNIWKLLRLPNNLKLGGIKSIKWNSESTGHPIKLKIKRIKQIFFNDKIYEIVLRNFKIMKPNEVDQYIQLTGYWSLVI